MMSNNVQARINEILHCQQRAYEDSEKVRRAQATTKHIDEEMAKVEVDAKGIEAYNLVAGMVEQAERCLVVFDAEVSILRAEIVKDQKAIINNLEVKDALERATKEKQAYKGVGDWENSGNAQGWSAVNERSKR